MRSQDFSLPFEFARGNCILGISVFLLEVYQDYFVDDIQKGGQNSKISIQQNLEPRSKRSLVEMSPRARVVGKDYITSSSPISTQRPRLLFNNCSRTEKQKWKGFKKWKLQCVPGIPLSLFPARPGAEFFNLCREENSFN